MNSVMYFPVVQEETQLVDLLSRAAWFLNFCPVERINILIASDQLRCIDWHVADGMDESIGKYFEKLKSLVEFVLVKTEDDVHKCMSESSIILKWKKDSSPSFVSEKKLIEWQKGKKIWEVDPISNRMEGSFYIEAGLQLISNKPVLIKENQVKFERLANKLGKFTRAYLMATGPSISQYEYYQYENTLCIICNSVILDKKLMDTVKPQILVFADPIFHFGPSRYAGSFRKAVVDSAKNYDFTICIPFKYYALFVSCMPELADRTIGIPFTKNRDWNFSLDREFELKVTANILTYLMIPLAATFANEIGFLGCDGRPLEEDTYFWGHNKKTQFHDKMANIRDVHPGFFSINYNDYYIEHCNTLEDQILNGEKSGLKFYCLTFSHIPALSKRIDIWPIHHNAQFEKIIKKVVIIDPDANSWSGHYMAYNEKLSNQLELMGNDVYVICRNDISLEILSTRDNFLPVLSVHSWEVGNRTNNNEFLIRFELEIAKALEEMFSNSTNESYLIYMYCGSLDHAKILVKLKKKYPFLFFNINLFWLSFTISQENVNKHKEILDFLKIESEKGKFLATLPTIELRNKLAQYAGYVLPVAPHPSTGLTDTDFRNTNKSLTPKTSLTKFNVLFPGSPRPEKGYLASIECAKLLADIPYLRPIIRHAPTFSTPKDMTLLPDGLPKNIKIVEGELDNKQFLELFKLADICVLPYSREAFSNRTSGLLIDSIYCGVPCVVLSGTWLSNLVIKYGCGEIVDIISPESIFDAVNKICKNYTYYYNRTLCAGSDYFKNNSWEKFCDFILGCNSKKDIIDNRKSDFINSLVGPFSREDAAHWDETNCIAQLFLSDINGSIMIDVGAHHGSALMPFLNNGWKVYAFEPDENNQIKLKDRLAKLKNKSLVSLDTRCVSNKSQKGVCFYRSEQSTGISGLSAFHESHVASQRVDTVTLGEYFLNKPMPAVDFLKIDTEGHDLFVLQGFPWERATPTVIECEFEDLKTVPLGYTFHDMARFLMDKGYTVYVSEWHPIVRYGIRHDWRSLSRYPCQLSDEKAWGNLLAFRDAIDESELIKAVRKVLKFNTPVILPSEEMLQHTGISCNGGVACEQDKYMLTPPFNQNWIACKYKGLVDAGKLITAQVSFYLDRDCILHVMLCRDGSTSFESNAKKISLKVGQHKLTLSHQFKHDHKGARIQIGVVDKSVSISNVFSEMTFNPNKSTAANSIVEKKLNKPVPTTNPSIISVRPAPNEFCVKHRGNALFLIGNGPSLRGFDFQQFNGIPTLGMNVAYRHWHKIKWYPTYYICLDTVVTESQKDGIFNLIQEQRSNKIKLFFLRKKILQFYPILRDNSSVVFFDDYLNTSIFDGANPLSTGSHAALFAAMLGYKTIYLLGIDCNYIQQISEAKLLKNHVLEMTRTPKHNPNYFIDNYQQKGDRYNIPDSLPDLHYRSWGMAKQRLERLGVDMVNCNPQSRLDMFDHVDIQEILSSICHKG